MRLSLLFVCLIGYAAACPAGMKTVPQKELADVKAIGVEAFQNYAEKACADYPWWIESEGLKLWAVGVTPACTDGKGTYTYTVKAKNPCKGNKRVTGSLTIDTTPNTNIRNWVEPLQIWAGTTVTRDPIQPLVCPKGLDPVGADNLQRLVVPFLKHYIVREELKPLFDKAKVPYCTVGFDWLKIVTDSKLSGCIKKGKPSDLMASAKIEYICRKADGINSSKKYSVNIIVSGQFERQEEWKATISL